jgi:hypothetical protein
MHRRQRPQSALIDDAPRPANQPMPAPIEPDQGFATGAGRTLHQTVRVVEAQGQRLFHEQVLASIDHGKPDLGMKLGRRADRNQIDAGFV